jgi:poly(A) polymerase
LNHVNPSKTPPHPEPCSSGGCRQYGPDEHHIERESISSEALAVHRGLREAGFEAYLVGGCVRDLLLGYEPKDFDVSTNARPEQIHALFRRSRIVGRRFQIVHVRSGRDVIEVSTFRRHHGTEPDTDSEEPTADESTVHAESGMLLRDNVFGNVEEDALRRDFTINGLYYDPDSNTVLDFSTGVEDLERRLLRVIGIPEIRFQEDPVRMLRAMRFAAKLSFDLEASAIAAIRTCNRLLEQVPPARMFDEVLKLLLSGRGEETFVLLDKFGLFAPLFPQTARALGTDPEERSLVIHALRNSDERIAQGKSVTPAFLFAALLWPAVDQKVCQLQAREQLPVLAAMHEVVPQIIAIQTQSTTIPKRFSMPMREIWDLQQRLVGRRQPQKLAAHPRFRAAYDFVLLREQSGEDLDGSGDWWTRYQHGEAPVAPSEPRPRRSRRRRGASSKSAAPS